MATSTPLQPDSEHRHDTDADDLQKHFDMPSAQTSGSQALKEREEQAGYDQKFANLTGEANYGRDGERQKPKTDSTESLSNAENKPDDQIGAGYRADGKAKDNFLQKLRSSDSRLKRRVAMIGAAVGASIITSIFAFLSLIPLHIKTVVEDLMGKFQTPSNSAMQSELESVENQYFKTDVKSALTTRSCHSTIEPDCVIVDKNSGFFHRTFTAWNQNKLTYKLATQTDNPVIVSMRGSHYYLTVGGEDLNIDEVMNGKVSIFELPGTSTATRSEIRHAVMDDLDWWQLYQRYQRSHYLAERGIHWCVIACDFQDKFAETLATKKLAGQLYLTTRVLIPFSDNFGVLISCMLNPDQCSTKLQPDPSGRETSQLDGRLETALDEVIAKYGSERLTNLVSIANDLNKNGLAGYATQLIVEQIANQLGADGSEIAAGEAVGKVVPVAGQASLLLSLDETFDTAPAIDKTIAYTARRAQAVATIAMLMSVVSEMEAGHTDIAQLGSVTDLLSSGGYNDTESPVYNEWFGNGQLNTKSNLPCDNGGTIATSSTSAKGICQEEDLSDPGTALSIINDLAKANSIEQKFTPLGPLLPALNVLNHVFTSITGVVGTVAVDACKVAPPCNDALNTISGAFGNFITWAVKNLVPNMLGIINGARIWDVAAAGADILNNETCQAVLGCSKVSPQTAATIQNQQLAQEKADFQSMPLFARMFSTDTPYSLVSRMAMAMPTDLLTATNEGVSSIFTNPLTRLGSVFSSLFAKDSVFAASSAQADPFGIDQSAYDPDPKNDPQYQQALANPNDYWNANCVNGPMATYDDATNTLDTTAWQAGTHTDPATGKQVQNVIQDSNTEQPVNTTTNPCMLIHETMVDSTGLLDPSILPPEDLNADVSGSATEGN